MDKLKKLAWDLADSKRFWICFISLISVVAGHADPHTAAILLSVATFGTKIVDSLSGE